MLLTYANLYRLNLMTCKKPCKTCKCKEGQSTKAFREYLKNNPSAPEAKIFDV